MGKRTLRQPKRARSAGRNLQPKVPDERVKIPVRIQEGESFFDTEPGDNNIGGLSNGDLFLAKHAEVVGALNGAGRSQHVERGYRRQPGFCSSVVLVRADSLQDFNQDDVADSYRFNSQDGFQRIAFPGWAAVEEIDPDAGILSRDLPAKTLDLGLLAKTDECLKPQLNGFTFGLETGDFQDFLHQGVVNDDVGAHGLLDVYESSTAYTLAARRVSVGIAEGITSRGLHFQQSRRIFSTLP